jgi:hypothetical protein
MDLFRAVFSQKKNTRTDVFNNYSQRLIMIKLSKTLNHAIRSAAADSFI